MICRAGVPQSDVPAGNELGLGIKRGPRPNVASAATLLQSGAIQSVGRTLQGRDIGHGREAVVIFGKGGVAAEQLPLDEMVVVELGGDLEGEKHKMFEVLKVPTAEAISGQPELPGR